MKVWAVLLCSCAAASPIAPEIQRGLSHAYRGRVFELRQTQHYAQLYDENEAWLLSTQASAHVSHLLDAEGHAVTPPPAKGLIPAGTRVTITDLSFPGRWNHLHRMLTTPRFHPWVVLQILPGELGPTVPEGPFVLVLPERAQKEGDVHAAIDAHLAIEGTVTGWLASRPPRTRVAIRHREVLPGMALDEMLAAWGPPQGWLRPGDAAQVAWYEDQEVTLERGIVLDVRAGRDRRDFKGSYARERARRAARVAAEGSSSDAATTP